MILFPAWALTLPFHDWRYCVNEYVLYHDTFYVYLSPGFFEVALSCVTIALYKTTHIWHFILRVFKQFAFIVQCWKRNMTNVRTSCYCSSLLMFSTFSVTCAAKLTPQESARTSRGQWRQYWFQEGHHKHPKGLFGEHAPPSSCTCTVALTSSDYCLLYTSPSPRDGV